MKEDFIILIHRFGYEHTGQQPHLSELYKYLQDHGVTHDNIVIGAEIDHIVTECFNKTTGDDLIFKSEAYYRYLEYLEIVEARRSSKAATWIAIAAIVVTIITSVIQIVHHS